MVVFQDDPLLLGFGDFSETIWTTSGVYNPNSQDFPRAPKKDDLRIPFCWESREGEEKDGCGLRKNRRIIPWLGYVVSNHG